MNFDLITKHITPKFVLDIGAHVGYWYQEAVKIWPDARFWLIEGNPECEKALQAIVREQDHLDILLLSDSVKTVDFYTLRDCATATGASYYREKTPFFAGDNATVTQRKTARLDDITWQTDFAFPTGELLMKVDTQGSELDILKGGERTLKSAKAVILELSRVEYNIGAPLCDEVDTWMQEHGFKAADVLGDIVHVIEGGIIQNDVLYLRK